ncbi:MAG: acyl carrier protein [Aristaeellaceae bacterium]
MRQKIIDILMDFNEDVDYEREQRLIDEGYIDSLDLTAIILELEEAFGVRIDASQIEPENFNSVDAILELLKRYRAEQ